MGLLLVYNLAVVHGHDNDTEQVFLSCKVDFVRKNCEQKMATKNRARKRDKVRVFNGHLSLMNREFLVLAIPPTFRKKEPNGTTKSRTKAGGRDTTTAHDCRLSRRQQEFNRHTNQAWRAQVSCRVFLPPSRLPLSVDLHPCTIQES